MLVFVKLEVLLRFSCFSAGDDVGDAPLISSLETLFDRDLGCVVENAGRVARKERGTFNVTGHLLADPILNANRPFFIAVNFVQRPMGKR